MKRFIYVFTSMCCLFSCNINENSNRDCSFADAGEDKLSNVGSYVILDPSQSYLCDNEKIDLVEWIQDSGNPAEVNILSHSTLQEFSVVGFQLQGVYKFTLKITCKKGAVYEDDLTVDVKSRQASLIEDIDLEIQTRYRLNIQKGKLGRNDLLNLDSLFTEVPVSNNILSLNGLENCENLKYLSLGRQKVTDLSPIKNLIKLEHLDLNQNHTIGDISPLCELTNLRTLILYNNPIADISILENFNLLTYLNLLGTPITNIDALNNLVNLKTLYIDGAGTDTDFDNIEPLSNLINLKILDIADRGVDNLAPLKKLDNLLLLNVSYSNLNDLTPISNMKNLERLYIRACNVENLAGIEGLENLDFLDAYDNKIHDITKLQHLSKIHLIGLSMNNIKDISPLVNNPNLGNGVHLFIRDNPLSDKSINEHIPELIERGVKVNL